MDEKAFDGINVIPFVDIMLVLLTIVLTTSSFIATGRVPVHLPQASGQVSERDKARTIEIDASGTIHLDGNTQSLPALRAALADVGKETPFVLRADREVRLQGFVDVVDVLKQLGFSRVAVQTENAGR